MTKPFQNIPWNEVLNMIERWANTPEGAYLGSGFGGKSLLIGRSGSSCEPGGWANATARLKEDVACLRDQHVNLGWSLDRPHLLEVTVGVNRGQIPIRNDSPDFG